MGQRIRFILYQPGAGCLRLGLPNVPIAHRVCTSYQELVLRAVHEILQPLGISEQILKNWLFSKAGYSSRRGQFNLPMQLS